ncbi:MAG: DNA polymerase III subunit delta [Bacteroidetes bacterium HGW-Bacteroidetes-21]|jgi:DNA polymerase-3 subunit delta'|nr:MAG: DNA polymerase III subunit delta [Bacteroidetes bacterium HGW-Bacteroidetes-21]
MLFSEVIGQQGVKSHLIGMVQSGRISHALLLHGPEGVGKLPLALAYAQFIHCENPGSHDACGVCSSCRKHSHQGHPDLHFVFPVFKDEKAKKKPVSDSFIEEWREMLQQSPYFSLAQWFDHIEIGRKQGMIYADESAEIVRKLSLRTYESEYKIIIVAYADKMNITAANKLLKILEEPTDKTLFILTSSDAGQILPTIFSRCQPIQVLPIDKNILFDHMVKTTGESPSEISACVNVSAGSYTRAMECLQAKEENARQLDVFVQIMRHAYASNASGMIEWAEMVTKLSKEEQKETLEYFLVQLRGSYMKTRQSGDLAYLNQEENAFAEKFHAFIHDNNINLFRAEIERSILHLERNGSAAMIFLDMALSFSRYFKMAKN